MSIIKWVGGKSRLAKKLIPLFPRHDGYVEVFGGSASIMFNKYRTKWEVLNDFDSNLINFWEVVKESPDEFIKSFEYVLVSRETFNKYKDKYKSETFLEDCTKLERAHIFYYLVKAGFGASMLNPSFGTGKDRNRLRLDDIKPDIKKGYNRLKNVTIENDSFEKIIERYDGKDTFFFMDPPYRSVTTYAVGDFGDENYLLMAELCRKMEGKFMITINDDEYIREIFDGFHMMDHGVFYSMSREQDTRRKFGELIITNYNPLNI